MTELYLDAKERTAKGKNAMRKIRSKGRLPGVWFTV